MLSDIVDYGFWKFGNEKGATYFSTYTFIMKANMALGVALGMFIAGSYGFDPANSVNSENSIKGLQLAIAWLPASFTIIALFITRLINFDERKHEIICKRLKAARLSLRAERGSL